MWPKLIRSNVTEALKCLFGGFLQDGQAANPSGTVVTEKQQILEHNLQDIRKRVQVSFQPLILGVVLHRKHSCVEEILFLPLIGLKPASLLLLFRTWNRRWKCLKTSRMTLISITRHWKAKEVHHIYHFLILVLRFILQINMYYVT